MQKAKELLTGSSLQIKEIANACGFENEYYFSNFFKKHIKMSPSDFRNATQV
jgi:AraC-like DNA-binding protein